MKEKNRSKIKTSQWFKTLSKLAESSHRPQVHRMGHKDDVADVKAMHLNSPINATRGNRQQRRALVNLEKKFKKSKWLADKIRNEKEITSKETKSRREW